VGEERDGMRARKFGHAYGFGLGADNEEIIFLYLVISVSFKVSSLPELDLEQQDLYAVEHTNMQSYYTSVVYQYVSVLHILMPSV